MVVKAYSVKSLKISGTKYSEVFKKAFSLYQAIQKKSKRKPYLRSAYFDKEKIFLGIFWSHLQDKHHKERARRLKYFPCALDLIKNSKFDPSSKENKDKKSEILHRFTGITIEKEIFFVQIKENKRSGQTDVCTIRKCISARWYRFTARAPR